jgi:isopenicillin-N epimerase
MERVLGPGDRLPVNRAGSMAAVSLPPGVAASPDEATELTTMLFERARIEVPFTSWNGRGFVRLSAHVYNRPEDYERLAEELPRLV